MYRNIFMGLECRCLSWVRVKEEAARKGCHFFASSAHGRRAVSSLEPLQYPKAKAGLGGNRHR